MESGQAGTRLTPGRVALFGVLVLAVVAKALQPGPFFSLSADPEPFPKTYVAVSPPTPDAHRDKPSVRVLQLLSSMNVMWGQAFDAAGTDYEPPSIESRGQSRRGCGGTVETDWAGVYCSTGTQVATVRAELHAECLAGVWGRAAGRRPPPPWSFVSDADHGTAQEQQQWFQRGYAHGRPAACDAIWGDEL